MKKLCEETSVVVVSLLSMTMLLQLQFSLFITCIQKESEALLRLKNSFDDPSQYLASWNGVDCWNWNGVGCNPTAGHVTKNNLRRDYQVDYYSRLHSNSIDASLLEFKYLNYLDLSMNDFNYTQIPNFLGSLVKLTYLNLSLTLFFGKLPLHLENLTKLVALDLSSYRIWWDKMGRYWVDVSPFLLTNPLITWLQWTFQMLQIWWEC